MVKNVDNAKHKFQRIFQKVFKMILKSAYFKTVLTTLRVFENFKNGKYNSELLNFISNLLNKFNYAYVSIKRILKCIINECENILLRILLISFHTA